MSCGSDMGDFFMHASSNGRAVRGTFNDMRCTSTKVTKRVKFAAGSVARTRFRGTTTRVRIQGHVHLKWFSKLCVSAALFYVQPSTKGNECPRATGYSHDIPRGVMSHYTTMLLSLQGPTYKCQGEVLSRLRGTSFFYNEEAVTFYVS